MNVKDTTCSLQQLISHQHVLNLDELKQMQINESNYSENVLVQNYERLLVKGPVTNVDMLSQCV